MSVNKVINSHKGKSFIELYLSGMSIPEVSDATGVHRSTVRYGLFRTGLLRSRCDAIRIAADKGRLGSGLRGKKRIFTDEWKKNISKSKTGKGKGWSLKPSGYIEITMGKNKFRSQHIVVVEEKMGRKLNAGEVVHHIDGDKTNNDINNLKLMTASEHASHHAKERDPFRKRDVNGRYV